MLIAEPDDFSPRAVAILRRTATVDLRPTSGDELNAAFQNYDVVWIRLAARITAEMLGPHPRCRILAVPTTGLDHIDLEACRERNIRVVSLRGEVEFLKNVRATAELTLALTLALLRQIPAATASVAQDGRWNRDEFRGHEIYEKTVGIVGVGRLGSIAAGYFRALGADVIGYDPRLDFPHEAAQRVADLHELLGRSDIVCVMVKYDETTRHLLGPREFTACKPGTVIVNTSRGGVIDEAALLAALESKQLSGAALDVLEGEPGISAAHPLVNYARAHANMLIVPHIGGNTFESFEKTETFLAERVVAALETVHPCAC